MPWFQVDDQLPTHPGVLVTSLAARGLWVTAGAWSSARLTDVVPDHVLAALGSTPELASELTTAGMLKRVKGGYRYIQQGTCKIPTRETVDNQRRLKTERQRRWRDGQRRRDVDASTDPPTRPPNTNTSTTPNPTATAVGDTAAGACPKHATELGHPHGNCRACGTNPRGKPPPSEAERHPSARPVADVLADSARRRSPP